MCGRYTLSKSPEEIKAALAIQHVLFDLRENFDIRPTTTVAVVTQKADGERVLDGFRWGFLPPWAKDLSAKPQPFNARAEGIAESLETKKGMFLSSFKTRRCLIPADGFYEWRKDDSKGKATTPFFIHMRDNSLYSFAGLWTEWKSPDGPLRSCTIITCPPNDVTKNIHDRMPVILPENLRSDWLGNDLTPDELLELLKPYPASEMEVFATGKVGNYPPAPVEELNSK